MVDFSVGSRSMTRMSSFLSAETLLTVIERMARESSLGFVAFVDLRPLFENDRELFDACVLSLSSAGFIRLNHNDDRARKAARFDVVRKESWGPEHFDGCTLKD